MKKLSLRRLSLPCVPALALAMAAGGCGNSSGPQEEGSDGKADSFQVPTEHGDLRFNGAPNQAAFTDDQHFHSWTFTLTDEAAIDIATKVSNNLDTVMFLYRRDPGEVNWGPNIAKNDDHDGLLASRITVDTARAGEYRIKVKPTKVQLRGGFTVAATCDGPGCPGAATPGTCTGDTFEPLPSANGMTQSCAGVAIDILSQPVVSGSGTSVFLEEKCDLSEIEVRAVDYYHEYFDDFVGFVDQFGDDVSVNVDTTVTKGGTIVGIDTGGDEDGMTLLFDTSGKLITLYQHNQSPDNPWFCDTSSEPQIDSPGEDCMARSLFGMPHSETAETRSERTTTLDELAGEVVSPRIQVALDVFAEDSQVASDDQFTMFVTTWGAADDDGGAEVAFDGPHIGTYYVVDPGFDEPFVAASLDEEGDTSWICTP